MTVRTSRSMYDGSTKGSVAYGVTVFGGVALSLVAVFQILEGISAIAKDHVYVNGIDYAYKLDVSTWGWIHLVIGLVALGTGVGILMGQVWAFILGIMIAFLSAMANFATIPHYPFWSIVVLAFDILVIWALATQTTRAP